MSTQTSPGGPVLGIALLRLPVVPESDAHAHNAQHAQVVHQHVDVEVPESFSAKDIQVSENGVYDSQLPAGLVTEYATVTEILDVIDDAYIRVQPDTGMHKTSILVGFDPDLGQSDAETGIYVHRNRDVIVMSHKEGIRAPKHMVEGRYMEAVHFNAQQEISSGHKIDAPSIATSRISPYPGNSKKTVTIDSALILQNGGINASNTDLRTIAEKIGLTRGDIVCRNLYATGTVKGSALTKHVPLAHEDQGQLTGKSLRLNDESLYIGLMRRSYDRATHKPVTHILKRQIPTYLVAQGFVLADIPSPFTVDNMTIHNWIVLAQGFMSDTTNSIEIDTVFPSANTADWEDYISPVSIDLDAAEVEIDALDTRITALETISGVVVFDNISDNDDLPIASTDRIVLVRHSEKTGIVCTLPSSGMLHGQIIVIKNLQIGDGSEQSGNDFLITVRPAQNQTPTHTIDGKFTSLTLNATSDASGALTGTPNEACRLMWESINKTWIALNDAY